MPSSWTSLSYSTVRSKTWNTSQKSQLSNFILTSHLIWQRGLSFSLIYRSLANVSLWRKNLTMNRHLEETHAHSVGVWNSKQADIVGYAESLEGQEFGLLGWKEDKSPWKVEGGVNRLQGCKCNLSGGSPLWSSLQGRCQALCLIFLWVTESFLDSRKGWCVRNTTIFICYFLI